MGQLENMILWLERQALKLSRLIGTLEGQVRKIAQENTKQWGLSVAPTGMVSITVSVAGCNGGAVYGVPVTCETTGQTFTPESNAVTFDVKFPLSPNPQNLYLDFSADPTGLLNALRFQKTSLSHFLSVPGGVSTFQADLTLYLEPRTGYHCCGWLPTTQPLTDTLYLEDAVYGPAQITYNDFEGGYTGFQWPGWAGCGSGDFSLPGTVNGQVVGYPAKAIRWLYVMVADTDFGMVSFFETAEESDAPIDDTCDDLYAGYAEVGMSGTFNLAGSATTGYQTGYVPLRDSPVAPDDPTLAPDPRFEFVFWWNVQSENGWYLGGLTSFIPWNSFGGGGRNAIPLITVKEVPI